MSSTPSTVERAFEAALYADSDAALDTGASLLAADPASDDELARRGEEFVAAAWRRGWQPADVVRIVRR
ncbi:aromatic acid decarboxylase, partial [Streptomyces mirabilis]